MEDERVVACSAGQRLLPPTPHGMNLPPPPGHPLSTYVVQVPKDQIYRVPPPENASIVERHREAAKGKGKGKSSKGDCSTIMSCFFIVFILLCVIIGGSLTVIYLMFSPQAPSFSVTKLHVKQQKKGSPPTYHVTLKAKNLNQKMGIQYKSEEDGANLIFWTKNLGYGDIPELKQNVGDSTNLDVKIHGLEDKTVPHNVQKSISDKNTKHQISLKLKLQSPLLFNVWVLKLWKKTLDVTCDFRVSTLAQGTKILSQKCKTKLS